MVDLWSYTDASEKEKENLLRLKMAGWRLFYRGQSSCLWPIKSTLSRCVGDKNIDRLWIDYIQCFSQIKEYASGLNHINFKPQFENLEFFHLSNARHLGFPCNLIDWTTCLETALYFAANDNLSIDGAIWILGCRERLNDKPIEHSPFEFDMPKLICKEFDLISSEAGLADMPLGRLRRFRQNGFFSIIPEPYITEPFESLLNDNFFLEKFIVTPKSKIDINTEISPYVKSKLYGEDNESEEDLRFLEFVEKISNQLKNKYV